MSSPTERGKTTTTPAGRRVLVVRAGALGDTLMVTPLLRELHRRQPEAEIDFLSSTGGAALLQSNPHLSRIHTLRLRNVPRLLSPEKRALVREIRARHYDFAVLLETAPQYRELIERAGVPEIRGFAETPFDEELHCIVNNLRAAGFPEWQSLDLNMDLPVSAQARNAAAGLTRGLTGRPLIGLHAGYGPAVKKNKDQSHRLKGWSNENFAAVAGALAAEGASIVLTGSAGDAESCAEIARGLPASQIRILAGRTGVEKLAGVIEALDVMISVDSGPAHMAAAIGTPLVVLWGPAVWKHVRPMSSRTPITILNAGVPCAPCYGTPLMKECQRNICMEQITPEQVLDAARRMLALRPLHSGREA